jgi:hypothetical protein
MLSVTLSVMAALAPKLDLETLRTRRADEGDPVAKAILAAPFASEPLTPEQEAAFEAFEAKLDPSRRSAG